MVERHGLEKTSRASSSTAGSARSACAVVGALSRACAEAERRACAEAEAHSRGQRVSNALMGCGRPERSAPSCGIHTELGGRAEPLVAAPTDADHVLVSRANIFADDATGLDRHRKFSYGISTEHGTRPHSTAGEVPERTRPRCNTSTQTRTGRTKSQRTQDPSSTGFLACTC